MSIYFPRVFISPPLWNFFLYRVSKEKMSLKIHAFLQILLLKQIIQLSPEDKPYQKLLLSYLGMLFLAFLKIFSQYFVEVQLHLVKCSMSFQEFITTKRIKIETVFLPLESCLCPFVVNPHRHPKAYSVLIYYHRLHMHSFYWAFLT